MGIGDVVFIHFVYTLFVRFSDAVTHSLHSRLKRVNCILKSYSRMLSHLCEWKVQVHKDYLQIM